MFWYRGKVVVPKINPIFCSALLGFDSLLLRFSQCSSTKKKRFVDFHLPRRMIRTLVLCFRCYFILLYIKCQGCGASPRRRKTAFTNYDLFRSTYSPNTIAEDAYTGWAADKGPQEPILRNTTVDAESENSQHLYGSKISSAPEVVRCPYGWKSISSFCTTLSLVNPYTECPLSFRRFRPGYQNILFNSPDSPGLCQREDIIGISYKCPEGYVWASRLNASETVPVECQRVKILFPELQPNASDVFQPGISFHASQYCPLGYTLNTEQKICETIFRIPPEPFCPDGYELTSRVYDPYTFLGKELLFCKRLVTIKGKVWCPKGYEVSSTIYHEVPFGEVIRSKHKALAGFRPTNEALRLLTSGWTQLTGLQLDTEKILCFQVLIVSRDDCDSLHCTNAFLKQIHNQLIRWSYHQILSDPDYVDYGGLPSGKDFKMTLSGFFRL